MTLSSSLDSLITRRNELDLLIRQAYISAEVDPWATRPYHEFVKRAMTVAAISKRTILVISIPDNDIEAIMDGGARLGAVPMLKTPCPCGYFSDPHHACRCTATQILRHRRKFPDAELFVNAATLTTQDKLRKDNQRRGTPVLDQAKYVQEAQKITGRWEADDGMRLLEKQAVQELAVGLTQIDLWRGIATDIGRLAGHDKPDISDLAEAIQYRKPGANR